MIKIYYRPVDCMEKLLLLRVGTNSGMDYWNGPLDWTTGLSYFPFLGMFLHVFLEVNIFPGS